MKLTTDITWLLLSAVDNDVFIYFLCHMIFFMTLTESKNICYISDRVACSVELNIKETFLGNNGFSANVYIANELQSEIKRSITWRLFYLVREGRIPATLSPFWKTLGLMLIKLGIIKFGYASWIHQDYFWNSLWQTLKFIWNEVDN